MAERRDPVESHDDGSKKLEPYEDNAQEQLQQQETIEASQNVKPSLSSSSSSDVEVEVEVVEEKKPKGEMGPPKSANPMPKISSSSSSLGGQTEYTNTETALSPLKTRITIIHSKASPKGEMGPPKSVNPMPKISSSSSLGGQTEHTNAKTALSPLKTRTTIIRSKASPKSGKGQSSANPNPTHQQQEQPSRAIVIGGPQSGESSELAPAASPDPTDRLMEALDDLFGSEPDEDGTFLFDLEINRSNRLLIPAPDAIEFFPPLKGALGTPFEVEQLQLSDTSNNDWYVSFIYYPDENSFLVIRGWQELANHYSLRPGETIRFYQPEPCLHSGHYAIDIVKRFDSIPPANMPGYRPDNLMFQFELDVSDIYYCRLLISKQVVRGRFPAIETWIRSGSKQRMEILKFTDYRGKDWYMDVVDSDPYKYMVISGWTEFVTEHNLEAGDVLRFYAPVQPSHGKHFLIEIVVRRTGEKQGRNGGGGCGSGSDTGGHGDGNGSDGGGGGVGPSGSGGGDYKGKEIAYD